MSDDPKQILDDIRTLVDAETRSAASHRELVASKLHEHERALTEIASGGFFRRRQMTLAATIAIGVFAGLVATSCIAGSVAAAVWEYLATEAAYR